MGALTNGSVAQERGVPFVAPRGMRGEQGNPEITVYCPTCDDRVVPLRSGICGWCDTDLSADMPETNNQPDPVETPAPGPEPEPSLKLTSPGTSEDVAVASWRDEEIVAWLRSEGPATGGEIRERFGFPKGSQALITGRLRSSGLIEKTGVTRVMRGHAGRPGPEFCAVEPADDEPEASAVITAPPDLSHETPGETRSNLTEPPADPSAVGSAELDPSPELPNLESSQDRMTVHQQLVVRYVGALIGRVERAGMGGIAEPPEHVYERIERLLEIEQGVR